MESTKLILDFSGLKCPKPLADFQRALRANPDCRKYHVICTDANAITDFEAFQDFGVIRIEKMESVDDAHHFHIVRI